MNRYSSILVALLIATAPLLAKTPWKLDKAHSAINFKAEHIIVLNAAREGEDYFTMGSTVGEFKNFDITFIQDKPDFSGSTLEATIEVKSIDTNSLPRDNHLKSSDFFNAATYPQIHFRSTEFTPAGENQYKVVGELTIKGKTNMIELEARTNGVVVDDTGSTHISFAATGLINRLDYGLTWSELLENGAFRISNYVELTIQANFLK